MRSLPLLLAAVPLASCGGSLPQPRQTAPGADGFVEVPYPPPAALSELVPARPENQGAVFIDGGWLWSGSYYTWDRGGWVVPPRGARFAPWAFRYTADGRMLFSRGRWMGPSGQFISPPPILVPALTPPNEVTAEFQTGR